MCTNRQGALDPAVLRRAAAIFQFTRPGEPERRNTLTKLLRGTGIDDDVIAKLAAVTGPTGDRPGFTYSDLAQRLLPSAILAAFPDIPLTADILMATATRSSRPLNSGSPMTEPLPVPSPTGVRIAGDRYQWLVAWEACVTVLRDASESAVNPAVSVGVEVEAPGTWTTLSSTETIRRTPTSRSSTPSTAGRRSTPPTSPPSTKTGGPSILQKIASPGSN